jgi:hypothetical protein
MFDNYTLFKYLRSYLGIVNALLKKEGSVFEVSLTKIKKERIKTSMSSKNKVIS